MAGDNPFPTPVAVGSQDPSAIYENIDGRLCRLRGARSFLIAKVRTCGSGRISIDPKVSQIIMWLGRFGKTGITAGRTRKRRLGVETRSSRGREYRGVYQATQLP